MKLQKGIKEKNRGKWYCRYCQIAINDNYSATCAFDSVEKRFRVNYHHCHTLRLLKDVFRSIGKRTLVDPERERGGTTRVIVMPDGKEVIGHWVQNVHRGYYSTAYERSREGEYTALHIETAYALLDGVIDGLEAKSLGMTVEELEQYKYSISKDEDG